MLSAFIYSINKFGFTLLQSIALSALLSLIPAGSFTGFVNYGMKIKDIDSKKGALLIVFFPLILAFVTVSGIIMIIPTLIKSLTTLIRS